MKQNDASSEVLFLSVHPKYAEAILAGKKTVELRKQPPRVNPGDWVLIYATSPQKQLLGKCRISKIVQNCPDRIWRRYARKTFVSRDKFLNYFENRSIGTAIELESPTTLNVPISLETLREVIPGFQPPQGYRYFSEDEAQYMLA